MKIDKHTTLQDFMQYVDLFRLTGDQITDIMGRIEKLERPKRIREKDVPDSLNDLTYEELYRINSADGAGETLDLYLGVILGLNAGDAMSESAFEIFSFVHFVNRERIRIGKLFAGIKSKHTPEEVQAGVEKLNHGYFGTVDWYARRMGIQDHSDAERTKWIRIYQCLKMDVENAAYERRLRDIISKKK